MSGVEIRVRSDSRQARNDLNKLENSVKNIETRTAAAGKAFRNLAIGIGAAFTGGVAVKGINNATDSLTNLENRIALVTGRGKDLDKTMNKLFKIAKATRGDIGGSAETFNRFGLALKESGKGAEEILKAVESVNKAVAISGSGAESARAALFQLGQGLASGQLRGQELNSVLEQAPRLAQAIADEMGAPLGALRKLAEQGQVTTEVVFNALINQSEKLTKEFETMEGTSEQAFSVMKDQIGRVVGEISKGLGVTSAFTQRFNAISDSLETNREAIVSGVVGSFKAVGSLFSGISTVVTGTIAALAQVIARIKELAGLGPKIPEISADAFERAAAALASIVSVFAKIKTDTSIINKLVDRVADAFQKAASTMSDFSSAGLEVVAKYSKIASDNFKELYERALRFSLLKYLELRGGVGVLRDLQNLEDLQKLQNKVEQSTSRIFKNTANFAKKYLSQAWDSVKTFLNLIERKFYWVYDKVIQNSWWTDTMEQTYALSEKWLGKTADSVSKFGGTVEDKFKGVFESFKGAADKLRSGFSIDDIKIKISTASSSLSEFSKGFKESVTKGLKTAIDSLSSLSPVISASFGAALVAGVTRALSPELFKKTFGRIGPAAIAVLFAGIATDLADVLKDAGIFSALGSNLGTTIAIAFDAVIDAIPVLVAGLIQGVASAGKAFGIALEGSIIGLPAKILSFLPGGGLLTSILYGSLGLAAINSKFRNVLGGLISTVVSKSSKLTQGKGMLQTIFFGENFTRASDKSDKAMRRSLATSDKIQKKNAQNAAANFSAIAGKARIAHLGIMGAFSVGSVALLGDVVGTELSAIIGLVAGNIVSSLALTQNGFASLTARFAGLRTSIATGSVSIFTSISTAFKAAAVSAHTSLNSINAASTVTSVSVAAKFKTMASVVGTSFLKMGKFARFGIAGLAASLLLTSAAFADTGAAAEESGANMTNALLNTALAATTVATLLPSQIKDGLLLALKGAGSLVLRYLVTPFVAGIGSIVAGLFSLPVAIAGAIAAIVATVGGFSIYSLFFGEGDTFTERVKSNFDALLKAIFGVKKQTKLFRKEIDLIARSVEENLKGLGVEIEIVANIKRADLRNLSGKEQDKLVSELRNLEQLQAQAIREEALFGSVSTELLDKISKSTASIDKKTRDAGNLNINEASANRVDTTIRQILTATQGSSSLRGTEVGKEIAKYLRDEKINTDNPAGRVAIAETMTGFINQALSSGAISEDSALASFLPLFEEVMLRNGDIGVKTIDALDGFKAFTRIGFSAGKANNFTDNIQNAIQESMETVRLERLREERTGLIDMLNEASKQFGLSLPESIEFLGTDQLRELADYIRPVNTAANNADPNFEQGRSAFMQTDILMGGALQSEIDIYNRALAAAQLNIDLMDRGLQTVNKSIDITNAKLSSLGIPNLDIEADVDNLDGITNNLDAGMKRIQDTMDQIAVNSSDTTLTDQKRFEINQHLAKELAKQKKSLSDYVNFANQASVSDSERLGLLTTAAGSVEDYTFDINKLLGVDAGTLQSITDAQNRIGVMTLLLQEMNSAGADSVRGFTKEAASKALEEAKARVDELLKGTGLGKFTGKVPETAMEKFIGSLEDTGFEASMALVGTLTKTQISNISGALKEIEDANKRINKTSLDEVGIRQKSIKLIKEQRAAIFESLAGGTVGQAKAGLEGLGVDSSILDENNAQALGLAKSIANNQETLNNTLVSDLDTRKEITSEIERQQKLLDGITTRAKSSSQAIAESLKENLKGVLKGATSIKDALFGVLDTISNRIIDTVVDSFIESFFQASGLKEMFDGLFSNLFSGGDKLGDISGDKANDKDSEKTLVGGIGEIFGKAKDWMSGLFGEGGGLSSIFSGFTGGLGGIFGSLTSSLGSLSSLFGGGGGGDLGSLISTGLSFFGFSQGGVVPSTPFSQVGKDSVPAMLMPGEVVMSKNAVRNMDTSKGQTTQSFNINVQGDVSRQTRKEIVKMMPQIAGGVNAQNKESNYRR